MGGGVSSRRMQPLFSEMMHQPVASGGRIATWGGAALVTSPLHSACWDCRGGQGTAGTPKVTTAAATLPSAGQQGAGPEGYRSAVAQWTRTARWEPKTGVSSSHCRVRCMNWCILSSQGTEEGCHSGPAAESKHAAFCSLFSG